MPVEAAAPEPKACDIFREELARAGMLVAESALRAELLDARSVAVVGDARRYGRVLALRLAPEPAGAARPAPRLLPSAALDRAAVRIVNEIDGISRVVYDITDIAQAAEAASPPDLRAASGPPTFPGAAARPAAAPVGAHPPAPHSVPPRSRPERAAARPASDAAGASGTSDAAAGGGAEDMSGGVLIVDFGSQYTHLLARRLRELQVFCQVVPPTISAARIARLAPEALILSGGPGSAHADGAQLPAALREHATPMLGICYGMQLMAAGLGGTVQRAERAEYGAADIALHRCALFGRVAGQPPPGDAASARRQRVWMSHGDQVSALPPGFERVASSDNAPVAAMADARRRWYGVQFHPEVQHTAAGRDMLAAFLFDIAGCRADWTPRHFVDAQIEAIQRQVGEREHVMLALSGGVDSAVAALMAHRAIGERLHCVFVDNGLLRKGEAEQALDTLSDLQVRIIRADAEALFLAALAGVSEPEQKRRAVGEAFIRVFEAQARALRDALPAGHAVRWLAQGTIYPDVIESGAAGHGVSLIKSHHNVGGLPERMSLRLLEPLRWLFKDEVRAAGARLGLSAQLLTRHPFPGPGMAVRVLGEVGATALHVAREADAIFIAALRDGRMADGASCYHAVAQALVALLPGQPDAASPPAAPTAGPDYRGAVALRAVVTSDFMTASASWNHLPEEVIVLAARRIRNALPGRRVLYDITSKPPATVEWE